MYVLDCGFAEFLYRALYLPFGAKCLLQMDRGGFVSIWDVALVAKTRGFYLVCIWGSQAQLLYGGGVILKLDVFSHCFAVFCSACMQAMTHSCR